MLCGLLCGLFPTSNCRMRAGPVNCLCLGDDQLILSGSSLGGITVSGILSDQRVATLRSTDSTGFYFFPAHFFGNAYFFVCIPLEFACIH